MKVYERKILEKLWFKEKYYWEFNGNKVPRLISGNAVKVEALLDIERNHRELIELNKNLPNVQRFKSFFEKEFRNFSLIEEFPIPIQREAWKEVYNSFGGRKETTRNKMWFSLDFYIPALGLAIQLDSKIAHGQYFNKIRDIAEDTYLWHVHGIETIRSSSLQFDSKYEEEQKNLKSKIEEIINRRGYYNPDFDFSRSFVEYILNYYEPEFDFIDRNIFTNWIYSEITGERITQNKICIKKSNLSKKDQEFLNENTINSYIMDGIELTHQENLVYLFRNLFEVDIKFEP